MSVSGHQKSTTLQTVPTGGSVSVFHCLTIPHPSAGWQVLYGSIPGSVPPPVWSDISDGNWCSVVAPGTVSPVPAWWLLACVGCWQLISNTMAYTRCLGSSWVGCVFAGKTQYRSNHHPQKELRGTCSLNFILAIRSHQLGHFLCTHTHRRTQEKATFQFRFSEWKGLIVFSSRFLY